MLSGAVLVLSGAILAGAGTIARAVAHASNQFAPEADVGTLAGAVVGVIGLLILVSGFRSDATGRP
jgi:hypothetical protein